MMRLTFSLVLLVATFVAVSIDFSNAESAFFVHKSDNGFRGLRVSGNVHEERGAESLAKVVPGLMGGDDAVAKLSKVVPGLMGGDDAVAKLSKVLSKSDSVLEGADDEVVRMSTFLKKANAGEGVGFTDDELIKVAEALAMTQKSARFSDDQLTQFTKGIVDAKKAAEAARNSDDEVAKISAIFAKANSKAKDGAKYTDDEVVELGKAFAAIQRSAGFGDEQMKVLAKMFAQAKQATTSTDESIVKLSQELVELAQKDKKSWSTLKKVLLSALGVTVGGAVIVMTVKLATKDSPSPTTTVTSSGSS
ncbi:Hypothetical protein PHPALM_334 [Phytophthora palmivora]|uniref:Secreted RxLR effector peptide protein n=1 Tax=Phytophthora palmivora TaxID=4796 RepID=A0A2P4YV51_9STRA|nr:Hypothetical protein PHPALM_334 [Phytophthora palmivora]